MPWMVKCFVLCTAAVSFFYMAQASAAETVMIGQSRAVLLRPTTPEASVILMAGGDGRLDIGSGGSIGRLGKNQLIRTREAYVAKGLAVLVPDNDVDLVQAVEYMAKIKRPVIVIGTSRGTLRAARGIAHGARPDGLVLTSGFLTAASGKPDENVATILGAPAKLPPTLVIHHRNDECRFTKPAGVAPFISWAVGKARVIWLDGGESRGDPCQAMSHHGFLGLDNQVVSAAANFALKP